MEKTFASLQVNANELVCDDINYEADAIESFTHDDVAAAINNAGVDTTGPIYNYEWVDEVMQALNVSPDISNAFHVNLMFFKIEISNLICLKHLGNCCKHK